MVSASQLGMAWSPGSWCQPYLPMSLVQGGPQMGTKLVLLAESPREVTQSASAFSEAWSRLLMN